MNNDESKLIIQAFVLGPVQTNSFLVIEKATKKSVVIDPAWEGHLIVKMALKLGVQIEAIWLTHAHFDHLGGVLGITSEIEPSPPVALHVEDKALWQMHGGAGYFGMRVDRGPEPTIWLTHKQDMLLGDLTFEVRHCPGHTPGHVVFYCNQENLLFSGDVLFKGSIGRTDLPGGSYEMLLHSIRSQLFVLPEETRVYSGHGPDTTIGIEKRTNPFLI